MRVSLADPVKPRTLNSKPEALFPKSFASEVKRAAALDKKAAKEGVDALAPLCLRRALSGGTDLSCLKHGAPRSKHQGNSAPVGVPC